MTSSNPYANRDGEGSVNDDAEERTTKQDVKEDAREAKREAGAKAREQAEAGQHRVANEADSLSDAIDAAASSLDDDDREGLARYARELSSNLASAAGQLEGRSVDELAGDAKHLARNNPALFMLGSIAVGFGLSRFFKASEERDHHHDGDNAYQSDAPRSDANFRTSDVSTGMPGQRQERDLTKTNKPPNTPHNGDGRETL